MTLDSTLSIARSGLRLLDRQMARAADDIANAGTEGHTRKVLAGTAFTDGRTGLGVHARPPARDVDFALTAAADRARGEAAAGELRLRLLSGVEAAHGRPEDGVSLGGLLSGLHAGLIGLRESPADANRRGAVVLAAEDLAARFNGVAAALGTARQAAHDTLREEASRANAALAEIGTLTLDIRREIAAGRGAAALEDKRDLAIARLSESLELRAVRRADGDVTLIARGGVVLPLDGVPVFEVAPATLSAGAYHGGAGTLPGITLRGEDVTRRLAGGRLAAAAELRDATLPRMTAELDLAAAHLAHRFEQQGLRLFTDGASTVPDPALPYAGGATLGFAAAIRVNPAVEANPALVRDGTHTVVAGGGPTAFAPNPPGGPPGFATLLDRLLDHAMGGTVAPGAPHAAVAAAGLGPDGSLVSALSGLVTLESYGAALVAEHGAVRARAEEAGTRATAFRDLLNERVAGRSGVDVDKEVAAMVQLQTAYGVNARVISTVQAMWDALLGAVR